MKFYREGSLVRESHVSASHAGLRIDTVELNKQDIKNLSEASDEQLRYFVDNLVTRLTAEKP